MGLLAGSITHGQTVALILLCVFLIVFIVVDVYMVLFLRRKNKKLAKNTYLISDEEKDTAGTSSAEENELTEQK